MATSRESSTSESPLVAICMGSDSDWPVMQAAASVLEDFGIPFEAMVLSAHRMPREMVAFGSEAAGRGIKVIMATSCTPAMPVTRSWAMLSTFQSSNSRTCAASSLAGKIHQAPG